MQAKYRSILLTLLRACSIACVVAPTCGWAQQVTASVTGKVTDATGAAVPGAKVTATDTERGTQYPGNDKLRRVLHHLEPSGRNLQPEG